MFLLRGLDVNGSDDFTAFDHLPSFDHFESFKLAIIACTNVDDIKDLNGRLMREFLLFDLDVGDVRWEEVGIAEGGGDVGGEETEVEG